VFNFENYWVRRPGFFEVVNNSWSMNCEGTSAHVVSHKFTLLRKALKQWKVHMYDMDIVISNCNIVILMMDEREEKRPLHITECNFRNITKIS
jgi:hypothetical protein